MGREIRGIRMKAIIYLFIFFILTAVASASVCENIIQDLKLRTGLYMPKFLPYKNERFNVYTLQNETVGHMIIEKGVITSVNCTQIENPTYLLYIKDDIAVKEIKNNDKPAKDLDKKIAAAEIKLRGASFTKKVKGTLTRIGVKIAGWFGK